MSEELCEGRKKQIQETIEALKRNRMQAEFLESKEKLLERLEVLIPENAKISAGGSVTLDETGVRKWMQTGSRKIVEEKDIFECDWYLMSSNAITREGEICNMDGKGNRVSALIYGPKNVVIIAGMNKLVKNRQEAEKRIKTIAAPKNSLRLGKRTGCTKTGYCVECRVPDRICCNYVISSYQRIEGRIHIFLLSEEYGY